MRTLWTILATLIAVEAHAEGVNLSWVECGPAGAREATFACDTNAGTPFLVVASFEPPAGIQEFFGLSARIDIASTDSELPNWWRHGPGLCRGTSGLDLDLDFTEGPASCTDVYHGLAAGGFAYDVEFSSPNRARLRVECALPFEQRSPLDAGTEYYAFALRIERPQSTGAGACGGCATEACVVLNEVQLFQAQEFANDPVIAMSKDRNYVTWQSEAIPECPRSTPIRARTWGQVKSLYR